MADIFPEDIPAVTAAAKPKSPFATRSILGVNVAVSRYDEVVQRSLLWAREGQFRSQIFANVQVVLEAVDNTAFFAS